MKEELSSFSGYQIGHVDYQWYIAHSKHTYFDYRTLIREEH